MQRYQFLKSETVNGKEVAYLLDDVEGSVLVVPVRYREFSANTDKSFPQPTGSTYTSKAQSAGMVPSVFAEEVRDELPLKPLPLKPPARLAQVFVDQGMKGEAIENIRI